MLTSPLSCSRHPPASSSELRPTTMHREYLSPMTLQAQQYSQAPDPNVRWGDCPIESSPRPEAHPVWVIFTGHAQQHGLTGDDTADYGNHKRYVCVFGVPANWPHCTDGHVFTPNIAGSGSKHRGCIPRPTSVQSSGMVIQHVQLGYQRWKWECIAATA